MASRRSGAKARRDSHLALDRLHSIYRKFDVKEQTMANQVLAEWALSEDGCASTPWR
jgi:hypothetical protein